MGERSDEVNADGDCEDGDENDGIEGLEGVVVGGAVRFDRVSIATLFDPPPAVKFGVLLTITSRFGTAAGWVAGDENDGVRLATTDAVVGDAALASRGDVPFNTWIGGAGLFCSRAAVRLVLWK
jgi:hypothetical protein